jgi:hypothetical protein
MQPLRAAADRSASSLAKEIGMRWVRGVVVVAVLFVSLAPARAAKEERIELRWSELAQAVAGRAVQMVLPDGTIIKGPVLAVASDSLEIEIRKTSNRQAYPKGRFAVPRSSVSVLQTEETRGPWRAIWTAVGAGAAVGACTPYLIIADNEGGISSGGAAFVVGATAGAAVLGYFVGKDTDKRVTIITIVRE